MVLAVVALMGTAVGAQERERLISEAQRLVPGVLSDAQLDSLDRGWLVAKGRLPRGRDRHGLVGTVRVGDGRAQGACHQRSENGLAHGHLGAWMG